MTQVRSVLLLYGYKAKTPCPQDHIFHLFRAFFSRKNPDLALLIFISIFLFPALPGNSRSWKSVPSLGVKQSTLRTTAQVKDWLSCFYTIREGKWRSWGASAVLLKMWLKTLTKVTLPAVVMSSSLAKQFFIKWQHMTPKSIPNQ